MATTPSYNAPKWDEGAISDLTQKRSSAGVRALRQQMSRASASGYDNADVKRMNLRDALTGYGTALSSVMGEASEAAASEYGKKYGYEMDSAKTTYQGAMDVWQTKKAHELAEQQNEWSEEAATTNYERSKEMAEQQHEWDTESDAEWGGKMDKEYQIWLQKYRVQQGNGWGVKPRLNRSK